MNSLQLTLIIGLASAISLAVGFATGVLYERWQRQSELRRVRKDFDKLMTLLSNQVQQTLQSLKATHSYQNKHPSPLLRERLTNSLQSLSAEASSWLSANQTQSQSTTQQAKAQSASHDRFQKLNGKSLLVFSFNQLDRLSERYSDDLLSKFQQQYYQLFRTLFPACSKSALSDHLFFITEIPHETTLNLELASQIRQRLRMTRLHHPETGEEVVVTGSCLLIPAKSTTETELEPLIARLNQQIQQKGRNQVGLYVNGQLKLSIP